MSDLPTAAELPTIDAKAFNAFEAAGWDRKAANDGRLFGQFTEVTCSICQPRPSWPTVRSRTLDAPPSPERRHERFTEAEI